MEARGGKLGGVATTVTFFIPFHPQAVDGHPKSIPRGLSVNPIDLREPLRE